MRAEEKNMVERIMNTETMGYAKFSGVSANIYSFLAPPPYGYS